MKKVMSIAAIVLFMAGASAFACNSCGCSADKGKKQSSCCSSKKKAAKNCSKGCSRACCTKKAGA